MSEIDEYFAWCERERQKHRIMTAAEYRAWCWAGDALSHPSSTDAFPGGLTIIYTREAGYFGTTKNEATKGDDDAAKR